MTLALYPGSFDPITNGHIDIAMRAAKIFDQLIIAPYDSPNKKLLFSTEERLAMVREAMAGVPNVQVGTYKKLTIHYAAELGADVLVRGIRTVSDFEDELLLTGNYRSLNPDIEICCLMTSARYSHIRSSMVKEIARLGGDISSMVPGFIATKLYQALNVSPEDIVSLAKNNQKGSR